MQNSNKKKICIVTRSLGEGGADRVASLQSIFFSDLGYDVYIVSILNYIQYPYKGQLLNLGLMKEQEDTILGRLKRFITFKRFLKKNEIDVIIDHRVRSKTFSETLLSFILYRTDTIYMVHSYNINLYFPSVRWVSKRIYGRAKYIVTVSKGIYERVNRAYRFPNVITIPNPIDFNYIDEKKSDPVEIDFKYILWYGRFEDDSKNLTLLINAYNHSILPDNTIKLVLMGNGKDKLKIQKLISHLDLEEYIKLMPFSENPFPVISNAIFSTLSSKYEGAPMTILESLACGTPVVSVNYLGNNMVVKNEYNGLLVKNHDVDALSEAFSRFVRDKKLYRNCKQNALKSVKKYSTHNVAKQWEQIINT